MIHSVLEGICYHLRWQLEAMEKHADTASSIRLVGGGALSPLTCQILSSVLNRFIEVPDNPQNSGAVGAAIVTAVGLGLIGSIAEAKNLIPPRWTYAPDPAHAQVYSNCFPVFKSLYQNNRKAFRLLNQTED
jgi:xylulokinase